MEHHGVLVDRELLRAQSREFARQLQELLLQAHREAGHEFNIESPKQLQQILFEKLQLPVRRKTPDRAALDRRGRARGAGRELPAAAHRARVPRAGEAQVHLHRQAARAGQRAHRAHPHLLSPGGRGHRAAVLGRSQPAEHSDPPPRGAAHPPGVHRAARATCCWRPTTRRSSCASWRTCPATRACCAAFAEDRDVHQATAAEVFGVAAGRGHRGPAPHRQDDQLRAHLRHVAVRPGAQARHRPRRRAAVRRALLPALPGREALHGRDARAAPASAATSRRCPGGACTCRTSAPATPSCASTPSAAPSTRPCRAPPPTSSSAP